VLYSRLITEDIGIGQGKRVSLLNISHSGNSGSHFTIGPSAIWAYPYALIDPLGLLKRLNRRNAGIASLRIGRRRDFVIFDPALIEIVLKAREEDLVFSFNSRVKQVMGNGLLSTQGPEHREQRMRLKPLFVRREFERYVPLMLKNVERFAERWTDGCEIELASEMLEMSFDIICEILLQRLPAETAGLRNATAQLLAASGRMGFYRRLFFKKVRRTGDEEVFAIKSSVDRYVCPWVAESRSREASEGGHIMGALRKIHDRLFVDTRASDVHTRDELVTFLIAGHETTAMALAWTFYLISQHPDVETRIHNEIDSILNGRDPTLGDLSRLRYTAAALRETMRLYPPIWLMMRRTRDAWTLGEYTIPGNSYIHISPWVVHHDERNFSDPERFDPDRFLSDDRHGRQRFSYVPFGDGTRRCLGETMALTEAVLALATICSRWKLRLVPGHRVTPQPLTSLRPKYGIRMTLHERR